VLYSAHRGSALINVPMAKRLPESSVDVS